MCLCSQVTERSESIRDFRSQSIRVMSARLNRNRAGATIDLDGGRHAGGKNDTSRHLVDVDPHRDALGEADPGKDGVDGRETLTVGLRVRDMDRASDAVDVAAHDLIVSHQLDLGRSAHAYRREIRLLEIAVDPV